MIRGRTLLIFILIFPFFSWDSTTVHLHDSQFKNTVGDFILFVIQVINVASLKMQAIIKPGLTETGGMNATL